MAQLKIEQDTLRDTVTINGVRFSRALFEDLAAVPPTAGEVVTLVPGEHGALTMERQYGNSPSGTPSDWVDANVSGNPALMQAMKNFAENGSDNNDTKEKDSG